MVRALIAVVLALAALAPGAAQAARGQESLLQDDFQLLQRGAVARERALDDVAALGADGVRALVAWKAIAPARRPRGFDGADPADYAPRRWNALDGLVRGTAARGLSLLLSPSTPTPLWASRCARRDDVCTPSAVEYGRFLRALGRRYSGAYRDEDQGGGALPRVSRWSFGNEPNQPAWLSPQFARRAGVDVPVAAIAYRGLVRAGIAALRATGHARDAMLLGETGPIGRRTGPLASRPVAPAPFLRTLLCIDARGRTLRGRAARVRECDGRFPRLRVTGFAHHPYTRGGSRSPRTRANPATEITIATPGRLYAILDAAARRGRLPRRLPVHYTEYGFQTDPPDELFGVPLARQAEYLNQSDWMAFRDPRIRTVAQYKLVDDAVTSSFQSGLRFADGRAKPGYDAYRVALWVSRRGASRIRVYGQVRPGAPRAAGLVELQNAPFGSRDFRTVAAWDVRSRNGAFLRTLPRREGRFRLVWNGLASREAAIAPR